MTSLAVNNHITVTMFVKIYLIWTIMIRTHLQYAYYSETPSAWCRSSHPLYQWWELFEWCWLLVELMLMVVVMLRFGWLWVQTTNEQCVVDAGCCCCCWCWWWWWCYGLDGCGYSLRTNNVWLMLDAAVADGGGDVLTASSGRLRVRTLHEQRDLCGWCPQL